MCFYLTKLELAKSIKSMLTERRRQPLPKKIAIALGAFALVADVVLAGGAAAKPTTTESKPFPSAFLTETAKPLPTLKPIPTPKPTVEPTPSPAMSPTPEPTVAPTQNPDSNTKFPKLGNVIWRGPKDGKTVYLTFDDCYSSKYTNKAIQIAHDLGARITLFCIGKAIKNPAQAANMRLAIADGDEIENHTESHAKMNTGNIPFMKAQMADQMSAVRKDLKDQSYKGYLVRPPEGVGRKNPYFWKAAQAENLSIVMWTVSSGGSWHSGDTSPARIKKIMNTVNHTMLNKKGNLVGGTIVLEHARAADVAALPFLIKEIQAKGGRFGLVGDIVGRPDETVAVNNVTSIKQQTKNNNNHTEVFAKKAEFEDQQDIFNAAA
jgi:peptidoglycan/xylan/chitin deacetylase (PgdA/CDA1 family)